MIMVSNDSITAAHYRFYIMKSLAAVMLSANVCWKNRSVRQDTLSGWEYNYQADEAAGKMDSI